MMDDGPDDERTIMGDRRERGDPDKSSKPGEVPNAPGTRDGVGDEAAVADVDELDEDQINPLAPPVNTEAGA
jgi:hypothetical protein